MEYLKFILKAIKIFNEKNFLFFQKLDKIMVYYLIISKNILNKKIELLFIKLVIPNSKIFLHLSML